VQAFRATAKNFSGAVFDETEHKGKENNGLRRNGHTGNGLELAGTGEVNVANWLELAKTGENWL
jgi:hypothetical protein